MLPPTAWDMDPSCASAGSAVPLTWEFDSLVALVFRDNPEHVRARRCHRKLIDVERDAPLSKWREIGEFETLKDCQAAYSKSLAPGPDSR